MKSTHTSFLYSFNMSSHLRKKDKALSSSMNVKHYHRSKSDKHRKDGLKGDTKSHSFKLSNRPVSSNMSRLNDRKEHSMNQRAGPKVVADLKTKDFFGSKRNEVRYNKLKKKNVKNPLNIMNRAIINLNNSRTNSESSQERLGKSRERSTGPSDSAKTHKYTKLDGVTKFISVYDANMESRKPKAKSASSMTNYGLLKM